MTKELGDTIEVSGSPMHIYVSRPEGDGPFPAVIELHHRDGVDEFTKSFCQRLAANGYVVAAPDLFHRLPQDANRHDYRTFLADETCLQDITATLGYLARRTDVRNDQLGLVGHCMGGHVAWIAGLTLRDFKALVVLYGGDVNKPWGHRGSAPLDLMSQAHCPILAMFGKNDKNPSQADMAAVSAVLGRHGKRLELYAYDGAGHAFQNARYPDRYHREATEDSWMRMLAFLRRELAHVGAGGNTER